LGLLVRQDKHNGPWDHGVYPFYNY